VVIHLIGVLGCCIAISVQVGISWNERWSVPAITRLFHCVHQRHKIDDVISRISSLLWIIAVFTQSYYHTQFKNQWRRVYRVAICYTQCHLDWRWLAIALRTRHSSNLNIEATQVN
jgi:hypothetical protein